MRAQRWQRAAMLALVGIAAACDPEADLEVAPAISVSRATIETAKPLGTGPVSESVTIVNGGDGTLSGLGTTVEYSSGNGWLSTALDRTTATRESAATLRLDANPDALGLGSYQAVVLLDADGASNGPLRIRITLTVQPRPPAKLALATQPSPQVTNGAVLGQQPVVQLLNAVDQATPVAGVTVTATLEGDGQLNGATQVPTDASGRASFSGLVIVGSAGSKNLSFSASGLSGVTSGAIVVAPGPPAAIEAASVTSQSGPAGQPVNAPPRVRAVDQSGNPVSGVGVTITASPGSVVTPTGVLTTGADGIAALTSWTLRPASGDNTVIASSAGLAGSPITFTATGQVGPPAQLVKQSGDNLTGLVGATLGTPHVVRVADAGGNGVAGVTVNWAVGAGGGSVAPSSTVTDGNGLAQATRTLGGAVGNGTTIASANLSGGPASVSFTVTGAAAGPAQIVKVAGDTQTGEAGSTLPTALAVRVLDATSAPLQNVTVSWTTTDPTGSFPSGATSTTDATGLATATWRLGGTVGAQTAQAAVGGPAPAVFSATATPGPISPTLSTIAASPGAIAAGVNPASVVVTVRDGAGSVVSGATVVLSANGPGIITQPGSPTNASGVASGQFRGTISGPKVISATVNGVLLNQTATVQVDPGAPAVVTAETPTALTGRFGQNVSPPPAVKVLDAFGNPAAGAAVNFSTVSGAFTLTPTTGTVAADATGVARLTGWLIQPIGAANLTSINVHNRLVATVLQGAAGSPIAFADTAQVKYNPDIGAVVGLSSGSGGCTSGGCHPGAGSLTYANIIAQVWARTDGDSTATLNRLLAKIDANVPSVSHNGGKFSPNIALLFAAWIAQDVPQN